MTEKEMTEKEMTEREMKVAYLQKIMDESDYEAMDEILIEAFQATWDDDEQLGGKLVGKLGDVLVYGGTYTDKANNFLSEYFNSYGIEEVY
jgi:hypothetical protein